MSIYRRILELSKSYELDIASFLGEIVKIKSFSTKEKDVVERIAREMNRVGFDEVKIDGLGNVIGRIGNGKKAIAFDAHIDTVYPGDESLWTFDPFAGEIKDGKVFGRGTVDQKGGMASMVYAGKIIKELDINKDYSIYFTGTVMEEDCDGLCWQYIIKEDKIVPELVVITEPTNLNIYRGHRGRMEIVVEVQGRSCHGSAPERGDNAIYKISRIALEIEKLNERLKGHHFLGKGTIAVTQVFFSSPSQCAIPDNARIQLDRRLTFGETKESAIKEVEEACKMAGYPEAKIIVLRYEESAYTGLKYPTEKYYPTWVIEEDSFYLKKAKETYRELFMNEPKIDKWTFSTNGVAIMGMHNIPCIGFGPGNEIYAHAPDEFCPVEHLSAATAFYSGLVAKLNNKG
ncbi:MAG: YgeY family selenium metabolism-linked hydrolase [Deltaproteobacteria bacterium]|nr:YgeY family selenium metabolism-linked hydrolase [Deltaproteobacteria bacterium]